MDKRHTVATLLLDASVNPKVISDRLGWKNTKMLMDTYAHLLRTAENDATDALDEILGE